MDHVFARVKRLRKNPYFKLISNQTLYDGVQVNLANCVQYNPDHNLDEDSWFKVENFSSHDFCPELLKADFHSSDFDDLKSEKFTEISYIFSVQGDDFYFQKISPSRLFKRKLIALGEVATIEQAENRLIIQRLPDAIYFQESNVLVFRDLVVITSIFDGIDVLYREATNEEVHNFLNKSFIHLDKFTAKDVSKPNRKRIALAMATLEKMSDDEKNMLFEYINDYCNNKLPFDKQSSKFTVSKDDELKQLIYGIEQRFYTATISKQRRLANSVVDL